MKLLVDEASSEIAADLWDAADRRITSRITFVEAFAALADANRSGRLSLAAHKRAKVALSRRVGQMYIVEISPALGLLAGELAERHALRGYDAVHLASAIVLEDIGAVFVSWDSELVRAASAAGFPTAGGRAREPR